MKPWWDTCLINNQLMKKISMALRRGRQLRDEAETEIHVKVSDDAPTLKREK